MIVDTRVEQQRKVFGGLYPCAKFGWNRCSNFHNMEVLIFARLASKQIVIFVGYDPVNGVLYQHNPQKAHPCV